MSSRKANAVSVIVIAIIVCAAFALCGIGQHANAASKKISVTATNTTMYYTGKYRAPTIKVTCNGKTLKMDRDYKIDGEVEGKLVGKYALTVTAKNGYTGSKKVSYKIVADKSVGKPTVKKEDYNRRGEQKVTATKGSVPKCTKSTIYIYTRPGGKVKASSTEKSVQNYLEKGKYEAKVTCEWKKKDGGTETYSNWKDFSVK